MFNIRIFALLVCLCCSSSLQAKVIYEWEDHFTRSEKRKLTEWITKTSDSLFALTGPLPFDVHVRFYRSHSPKEPVPWAHTVRDYRQGVNFHVNPDFSLRAFMDDWTAPHELSHLVLYYVGQQNAWFAEGFASYMQFQVMHQMGTISWDEAIRRYQVRMEKARRDYDMQHMSFATAAPILRSYARYPTMYWGGAIYFLRVDSRLRDSTDLTLIDVLSKFLNCCRMDFKSDMRLINTLDKISDTKIFSQEYKRFSRQSGLPDYKQALENIR